MAVTVRAIAPCYVPAVGEPPRYRVGAEEEGWFEYDGPPASYLQPKDGKWPDDAQPKKPASVYDHREPFGGKGDHDGDGKPGGDAGAALKPAADAPAKLPANWRIINYFRLQKLVQQMTGNKKLRTKPDVWAAAEKLPVEEG